MKYPLLTVPKPISGSEVQKLIHALKTTKGDRLEVMTNQPEIEYQQLLLNKYRQQNLELRSDAMQEFYNEEWLGLK